MTLIKLYIYRLVNWRLDEATVDEVKIDIITASTHREKQTQ